MKTYFHILVSGEIPIYAFLKSPSVQIWFAVSSRGRKGWVRQTRPQRALAKKQSLTPPKYRHELSTLNSWVPMGVIKTSRFPAWLKAKMKRLGTQKGSLNVIVSWADDDEVYCGLWHDTRRLYGNDPTLTLTLEGVRKLLKASQAAWWR